MEYEMRFTEDGNTVRGWCDYNGKGEKLIISLEVDFGELTVISSTPLAKKHVEAKLMLACMNEAFIKAERLTR
jgi:hypothetical protein